MLLQATLSRPLFLAADRVFENPKKKSATRHCCCKQTCSSWALSLCLSLLHTNCCICVTTFNSCKNALVLFVFVHWHALHPLELGLSCFPQSYEQHTLKLTMCHHDQFGIWLQLAKLAAIHVSSFDSVFCRAPCAAVYA